MDNCGQLFTYVRTVRTESEPGSCGENIAQNYTCARDCTVANLKLGIQFYLKKVTGVEHFRNFIICMIMSCKNSVVITFGNYVDRINVMKCYLTWVI